LPKLKVPTVGTTGVAESSMMTSMDDKANVEPLDLDNYATSDEVSPHPQVPMGCNDCKRTL